MALDIKNSSSIECNVLAAISLGLSVPDGNDIDFINGKLNTAFVSLERTICYFKAFVEALGDLLNQKKFECIKESNKCEITNADKHYRCCNENKDIDSTCADVPGLKIRGVRFDSNHVYIELFVGNDNQGHFYAITKRIANEEKLDFPEPDNLCEVPDISEADLSRKCYCQIKWVSNGDNLIKVIDNNLKLLPTTADSYNKSAIENSTYVDE